jgi:hypothetical protein
MARSSLSFIVPALLVSCVELPEHGPGAGAVPPPQGAAPRPALAGLPSGPVDGVPAGASGRREPPGFQVEPGQGVIVTGVVRYEGDVAGVLRIDVLPAQQQDDTMPGAAHSVALEAPGSWSFEAPRALGATNICAYIDTNDDGPSRGEPKVLLDEALWIGQEPIEGIELIIRDDWDVTHGQDQPKRAPNHLRGGGPVEGRGPSAAPAGAAGSLSE